jgi:hypothetical protein
MSNFAMYMAVAYWIHKCVLANKEIVLFSKVQKNKSMVLQKNPPTNLAHQT